MHLKTTFQLRFYPMPFLPSPHSTFPWELLLLYLHYIYIYSIFQADFQSDFQECFAGTAFFKLPAYSSAWAVNKAIQSVFMSAVHGKTSQ